MILAVDFPQIQQQSQAASDPLLKGDILLKTRPHTSWGGGVTALMYLPLSRSQVWETVTCYARWAEYLPNLLHSTILEQDSHRGTARLHQAAGKEFLMLKIKVEVYLQVHETPHRRVLFNFERGDFKDFSADLRLQDYKDGTLLSYSVQATPTIPVPSALIQQGIKLDLPHNLKHMRQVLCEA